MKVGIIGAGIQAKAAHLPAFCSINNVEVVGIADINKKSAELVAKKFGVPFVYTDFHDMLNEPDIDLISICTPHHLHKQMAVESARAGKHILIEKPMATTIKDANDIIEAAKENGVKLCVVQNYRLFPSIKEAKRKIENGRLGEIITLHGHSHVFTSFGSRSASWIIREDSAGIIEDAGSHLIDIILYLNNFEEIKSIYAVGGSYGGYMDLVMQVQIMIEFENYSSATLDISGLAGTKEIAAYVQGTGGLLHIDVRNDHIQEIHQYSTPLDDVDSTYKKLNKITKGIINGSYFHGAKSNYLELIKQFIRSIENNTKPPITGEEGRMTALVIECALKSLKEKRRVPIK